MGLVCFNNFYYCRLRVIEFKVVIGSYASIISTIVDTAKTSKNRLLASMLQ